MVVEEAAVPMAEAEIAEEAAVAVIEVLLPGGEAAGNISTHLKYTNVSVVKVS